MFSRIKLNSLMNSIKVGLKVASTQIEKAKLDSSLSSQALVGKIILVNISLPLCSKTYN